MTDQGIVRIDAVALIAGDKAACAVAGHARGLCRRPARPLSARYRFCVVFAMCHCRCSGRGRRVFPPAFDRRVALLRGNYYPERPAWAGADDFGIATHTDDGCLTLLATDGSAALTMHGYRCRCFLIPTEMPMWHRLDQVMWSKRAQISKSGFPKLTCI